MMNQFEVWHHPDGSRTLVELALPLRWDRWYGFQRFVKKL